MFRSPEHNHNLSMRLSAVLKDIGVTENKVKKTRRRWMVQEALDNIFKFLWSVNSFKCHHFGSQSEVSTTKGLNSDVDYLVWSNRIQVIEDLSKWQHALMHFLMIQDETTSPGYCLLQKLRDDAPLPDDNIQDEHYRKDSIGRVLLKHSIIGVTEGVSIHGPAQTYSKPYQCDIDYVFAFHCQFWPREADLWLHQHHVSGWPTEDMKRYSSQQGCFVVPVGSRTGIYPDTEWRISTSFAERCLMFSLNITQLRCYILLKMIIKTYIKPKCGQAVSSFMCKNILFYCIAGAAPSNTWNEGSLLTWLTLCLQSLFHCILTGNCPHFVIPRNNLLAGKLSAEVKTQVADIIFTLTVNIEQALLCIKIDDLGYRLNAKSGSILSGVDLTDDRAAEDIYFLTRMVSRIYNQFQIEFFQKRDINPSCIVSKLFSLYVEGSEFDEKVAIKLLTPLLCTSRGSMIASTDIQHNRAICPVAFRLFSLGLSSDVSSSRLKLASALYCCGDLDRCEEILCAVRAQLPQTTVQPLCPCSEDIQKLYKDFVKLCCETREPEDVIKHNIALCVQYLPREVNCVPFELRYEMFRYTKEDRAYRGKEEEWMDWAVVDSLPYLFFLQHKVGKQLQRSEEQHRALNNLAKIIATDDHLSHRETALNLLGQCMEQEGRQQFAFKCYFLSLKIRGRNNAAKWHLCRLLARLFAGRQTI